MRRGEKKGLRTSIVNPGLTRRSFIAGSSAALAAFGLGACTPTEMADTGEESFTEVEDAVYDIGEEGEWKPAYCVACHNPICGTQVLVKDGIVTNIKGDPASPTNQGMICARGLSVISGLYSPYRVKVPMKRTNPEKELDNDPGWVEISWDEALDTCTAKLKECLDTDPRTLMTMTGFGNEDSFKRLIFEGAFGTPNANSTSGPLCADHFGPMATKGSKVDRCDMERCEYLLLMGRSVGDEWGLAHQNTKEYVEAYNRGMKIVTVNPRKTNSAQTGEWVPIAPGTDVAFCYALVNAMLYEIERYDEHFLKVRTNAPYLIEDVVEDMNGTPCCFSDYERDTASGKPLVWDESTGQAVTFDTAVGDTYALFGTYEVNGKQVKTALQLIKDYVKDMTPEWAEKYTTIPADTIRRIANELVEHAHIGETIEIDGETFPFRPVCALAPGRGSNSNPLNVELFKAIEVVNELLGCIDVPGGSLCIEAPDIHAITTDDDGMLCPPTSDMFYNQTMGKEQLEFPPTSYHLDCFYPHELHVQQLVWRAILDPESYYLDYTPKVMFTLGGGNPFRSNSRPQTVIDAYKSIPFHFTISLWFDENTQFADIVLPEHHALERSALWNATWITNKGTSDYARGLRIIEARKPVVDPVYDTRQQEDLLIEFAKRLGILPAMIGIANNAYQGRFQPNSAPGLGDYAFDPAEFMADPAKIPTYADIIEAKLNKEFDGAGWDAVKDCSVVGYKLPTIAESYLWHWHPENAYRIPVYFRMNARSAKMIEELCTSNNIEFPHADLKDVMRQYSGAPLFYEFDSMLPTDEYPLKVVQYKTHFQVADSTGLSYNPWLQDVVDNYDPHLKHIGLAPSVAADLGLEEGDEVVVESCFGGTAEGIVHLTEMVHPRTLAISGKWGARGSNLFPGAYDGPHYNSLINDDERDIGFMMGNLHNSPIVKVYKA